MSIATSIRLTSAEAALRDSHRLLVATDSLPPSGAGSVSWSASDGDGLLLADFADLGPFAAQGSSGERIVRIHRLDEAPTELADAAAVHAGLHRLLPEAGAAILSRPLGLAAWAQAGRALPLRYSPVLRASDSAAIPVVADLHAGNAPLAQALAADRSLRAVLIAGQGVLAWGRDLPAATRVLIGLEEVAHLVLDSIALGGAQPFPDDAAERTARGIVGGAI